MAVTTGMIIMSSLIAAQTANSVIQDRKAAKGAKKTAAFEAGILGERADDALLIGEEAARRSESSTRQLTGAQRVSEAAQGLDLTSGSAADVISSDARLGAMDAETIRLNAAKEALGLRKQADLVKMGGRNTAQSYINRSYGTLLSGATQMYGVYNAYGKNTTPRKPPTSTGNTPSGGTY